MNYYMSKDKNVRLCQGDCLDVMEELVKRGVKVDAIITSPPYNLGKEYEKKIALEIYLDWQRKVFEKAYKVLTDEGVLLLNVGAFVDENTNNIPLAFEFYPILKSIGFHLRQNIVWHFNSGLSAKKKLSGRHENIMWFYKGNVLPDFNLEDIRIKNWKTLDKRNNPKGKNPTDVWDIPIVKGNSKQKKQHPCQFPEKLIERLVKGMTNENDIILDPFMRSGTTGVACVNTGRNFIGIELDEKYFEIAKNRIKESE